MNTKMLAPFAAAIAASFMLTGLSEAQTIKTSADLRENKAAFGYVFSHAMLKTMYRLGVEQDKMFGLESECKSQYHVKPAGAMVLKPIEFSAGKEHPTGGVWMSRYQLERCGASKSYNALFLANMNGEMPLAKPTYAGATNAGPNLVQDAMMSAARVALARSGINDCKVANVFDMRVTGPAHDVVEGDKVIKGVWNEIWTFAMCGPMIDVAMTFVPDANGGGATFTAGPSEHKN